MKSSRPGFHSIGHHPLTVSIGVVGAVWLLAVSRWVAGDLVVPWDSKNQFYAFFRFLSETLRAGEWPFWNPYQYGGYPSVADPQSLVLNPVFVIWGLLDSNPSMRVFDLVVFSHLLAGGVGVVAIGWRAAWPIPANVLAAAVFMFGGAASGRLQHTGIILAYALFPLALLLLHIALERSSLVLGACFALAAANIALGRNQVALLLCALLSGLALAAVLGSGRPWAYLRERAGVLATMSITGTAVLILPLLLTIQFAQLSNRPAESVEDALRGSFYPANFANLAVANIFGTHRSYWGPGAATLPAVALTDDSENYLFFGAVPTLLIVWWGLVAGGAWRPGRRAMTVALFGACLFMLGRYTPFYGLAFKLLPGVDLFRRPTDGSFVFGIAFAMLAGHCLSDYVKQGVPRFRLVPTIAAASAYLAIVAWAVMFSAGTGHGPSSAREALGAGALMVVVLAIVLGARRGQARMVAAWLLALLAVGELLWWNAASRLNAEPRTNYSVLEMPTGAQSEAIAVLESAIAADHRNNKHPRVEVLGLGGAWQNLAMVRGWEATNGYNPLRIGLYDRLVAPGEENWDVSQRRFPSSFANYDAPLARKLGLTYLVLGQPLAGIPALSTPPAAELIFAGPPVWIYHLEDTAPRAIFESGDAKMRAGLSNRPSIAKVESLRPGRVELVTASPVDGVLVLHDNYYPGWTAEVDGVPAPIRRSQRLFREVAVPAGHHRVIFQFSPVSLANLKSVLSIRAQTKDQP
jgi:hypothetical protein